MAIAILSALKSAGIENLHKIIVEDDAKSSFDTLHLSLLSFSGLYLLCCNVVKLSCCFDVCAFNWVRSDVNGAVDMRVSDEMNDDLLKEFKGEEVWRALKQMHPTKSPGLDGMSPIFFQKYWDVVGPQVVDYVLKTLETCDMFNGINNTYICLIPKVNCPKKITDFRPISLCNVIYKLVSKVLANRLKKVLSAVISDA